MMTTTSVDDVQKLIGFAVTFKGTRPNYLVCSREFKDLLKSDCKKMRFLSSGVESDEDVSRILGLEIVVLDGVSNDFYQVGYGKAR